jgi:hypothetical protein
MPLISVLEQFLKYLFKRNGPRWLSTAITLQSRGGRGSTFMVHLPIISYQPPEEDKQAPAISAGTESILLVDDEHLLTDMGTQMLERLGYRVTATNSSVEALDIFNQQPGNFDLVIRGNTLCDICFEYWGCRIPSVH